MQRTVVINEKDLLKIKESIEDDVYTIGGEQNSPMGGAYYHVNNSSDSNIDENMETEVEPSDVNLSSFKKQDELTPKIWKDDETLDSRIRLKLLDIADDFWESVNITWVKPQGIILTGSICNFNWSKYSDIDLHLIVDFDEVDEKTEFVRQYMDSKKNEWNEQHKNLKIMGYDVELYVQNVGEMPESSGIYDLEENEWIEKPNGNEIHPIQLNKFPIKDKAAEIMTIIDDMYDEIHSTDDKHVIETIGEDASHLWKLVKSMRTTSLEKDGESGNGNIVYKVLRRSGYLDKLFDLFSITYDKVNSIDESMEIVKEYVDNNHTAKLVDYFKRYSNENPNSDLEKAYSLCSQYPFVIERFFQRYDMFDLCMDLPNEQYYDTMCEFQNHFKRYFNYDDYESYIYNVRQFIQIVDMCGKCDDLVQIGIDILGTTELPTWHSLEFKRVVKNEWCIHFGKDSYSIAKNGFTSGTQDLNQLGFTQRTNDMGDGYNFAYLASNEQINNSPYGNEAVIFRARGVLCYHYYDYEEQVIFYGKNAKDFIPLKKNQGTKEWEIVGANGKVLYSSPYVSDLCYWVNTNLQQYRKQIMYGTNGIRENIFRNENMKSYITEEVVADGNSEHNPYAKRWKAERQALKDFLTNYGKIMTSKENGKEYKVYYDKTLSELIGINYCLCLQWDRVKMKPESTIYVRALDKFTDRIFQANNDTRGRDNQYGTSDDLKYQSKR